MIEHVAAQNTNEILAGGQQDYTPPKVLQLAAEMKDREPEEGIHRRVSHGSQEDRDSLNSKCEFESRALIGVVEIICLQR